MAGICRQFELDSVAGLMNESVSTLSQDFRTVPRSRPVSPTPLRFFIVYLMAAAVLLCIRRGVTIQTSLQIAGQKVVARRGNAEV